MLICEKLKADPSLTTIKRLPERMTLIKRPSLDRMKDILNIEPKVDFEAGVELVCNRIKERISEGEIPHFTKKD